MANNVKGIIIKIGADTLQFDNSVAGVKNALRQLKKESSDLDKALKLDPTDLNLLNKKLEVSEQQMTLLKRRTKELNDELATTKVGTKAFNSLQSQLLTTTSQLEKVTKSFDGTKKVIDDLGNTKSILNINNRLDTLRLKLEDVNNKLELDPNNMSLVAQKIRLTVQQTFELNDKLKALREEQSKYVEGSKQWQDVQVKINGVQKELNGAKKSLDSLGAASNKTANEVENIKQPFSKINSVISANLNSIKHELDKVNAALKFDPKNPELLAKKLDLLEQEANSAANKLKQLLANANNINEADMGAYQKEIKATELLIVQLDGEINDIKNSSKQAGVSLSDMVGKLDSPIKKVQKELDLVNTKLRFDSDSPKLLADKMKLLEKASQLTSTKLNELRNSADKINEADMDAYQAELHATEKNLIELNGELKNTKSTVQNTGKSFSDQMSAMKKSTSGIAHDLTMVNTKLRFDPNNVKLTAEKMNLLKSAVKDAESRLAALRKMADKVDAADMDSYQAEIRSTEKELVELKGELSQISSKTKDVDKQGFRKYKESAKSTESAVSNVKSKVSEVKTETDKLDKAVKSNRFFDAAIWSSVFSIVQRGINQITSASGDAIDRVDMLNKFPKMMTQLGYDTDKARESLHKMKDSIQGLPTRLDDIAGSAVGIAAVTGSLEEATNVTIAFNNAMIGYGATSDSASNAMRQFSQALGSGKMMAEEFNSISEAAPGLMAKMAHSFGITGPSAVVQFKEALKTGEISAAQFAQKLVELNEGQKGFAALAQTSAGGIKTSMQNIRTAIVNGLATSISAVEAAMQANGFGSIAENLDKVKARINENFKQVHNVINFVMPILVQLKNVIDQNRATLEKLAIAFGAVVAVLGAAELANKIAGIATAIGSVVAANAPLLILTATIGGIVSVLHNFFTKTEEGKESWRQLTEAVNNFVNGVKPKLLELWATIKAKFEELKNVLKPLFEGTFKALGNVIGAVVTFIVKKLNELLPKVEAFITNFKAKIDGLSPKIQEFAKGLPETIKNVGNNFKTIGNTIKSVLNNVFNTMKSLFGAISSGLMSAWQTISPIFGDIVSTIAGSGDKITGIVNSISSGLSTVFSAIEPVLTNISTAITNVWNNLSPIFTDIYNMVIDKLKKAFDDLKPTFDNLKNSFTSMSESISSALTIISEVMNEVWPVIKPILDKILDFFTNLLVGALNNISALWNDIWSGISSFLDENSEEIKTTLTDLITKFTEIFDGIWSKLEGFYNDVKPIIDEFVKWFGENIVTVIQDLYDKWQEHWPSIQATLETVMENISAATDSAMSTIKSIIEIAVDLIKKIWDGLKPTFDMLSGWFDVLMDVVKRAMEFVSAVIKETFEAVDHLFKAFKALLKGDWETFWKEIGAFFGNIWNIIKETFSAVVDTIVILVTDFINAIKKDFENMKTATTEIVKKLWDGIKKKFNDTVESVKTTVSNFKDAVVNFFTNMKDDTIKKAQELWKGITDKFNDLKTKVSDKVKELSSSVVNFFKEMKDNAVQKVQELWQGITDKFNNLKNNVSDKVREMINSVVDFFRGLPDKAKNAISNIGSVGSKIKDDIVNKVRNVVNDIVDFFRGLPNKIKNAIGDLTSIGSRMVTDILNGFTSFGSKLRNKVSDALSSVTSLFSGKSFGIGITPNVDLTQLKLATEMAYMPAGIASKALGGTNNYNNSTTNNSFSISVSTQATDPNGIADSIERILVDKFNL